jgi:hypothetical protein
MKTTQALLVAAVLAACGAPVDVTMQETQVDSLLAALSSADSTRAAQLERVLTADAVFATAPALLTGLAQVQGAAPLVFRRSGTLMAHHNVMSVQLDGAWMLGVTADDGRFTTVAIFEDTYPPVEDTPAVVADYQEAWNRHFKHERASLLEGAWDSNARYVDKQTDVTGPGALEKHIGEYQRLFGATRIEAVTGVQRMHGFVRFKWEIRAAGRTLSPGMDLGHLGSDGKLDLIAGFF